ncbi:serine hydrolase domain-containing protein [Massilia sp. LXY-6]|uniref:serine hydrolase domain-containing protein n=1 Tax=Massilia sp. LXY-6 TaxID=3379823 RepID=UPI003EE385AA
MPMWKPSSQLRSAALFLCAAAWAVGAPAEPADADMAAAARIERVENGLRHPVAVRGEPARTMALAERMRALHVPGLSVAVIDGGKLAWAQAYGVADAASGRPATPDTLFQAASISKPVTAILSMRLAGQGRIGLDEDINRRLRAWRLPGAQAVTARSLLSHTAGMPPGGVPGYGAAEPLPTLVQVLEGAPPAHNPKAEVQAVPGSRYAYSSLGYAVLQQYLIDAAGRPFEDLARDGVFAPLGMRDSLFAEAPPSRLAARVAYGHAPDGSVIEGRWRRYPELAAAGLWSTASDLARMVIALQRAAGGHGGPFLSQGQADMLFTPVGKDYGLGFELDHQGMQRVFHHSGANGGYQALMFGYVGSGQGAVVLANGAGAWPLIEELMRSIATEYGWQDYRAVERTAAPANAALYERFAGDYQVSNIVLHVERRGERLYMSGPPLGPDPVELVPAGDVDYFIREKDASVRFEMNGEGPVQTLSFVDGRSRQGKRR